MNRTAFRELLMRYVDGTATAEEKAMVDHWYELLYDAGLPALQKNELDSIEQEMWGHIEKHGNISMENSTVMAKPKSRKLQYYAVAAAIVLGITAGMWLVYRSPAKTFSYAASLQQKHLLEAANNTETVQQINLEDGSYVVLQPHSKMAYPKHFDAGKREVYMEGAAFFQVAKDASKPFYVYANELVTKVLGTSFDVQAFSDESSIKVIVHTGKVTVYPRKNNSAEQDAARLNATIIAPNQQILFNRSASIITKTVAIQPQVLNKNDNNIKSNQQAFVDTPASEVLIALQKAYGINIVFDEELLAHCTFTGTFTNETFFEKISLICKAIEATYEQTDGQIIITGHNCEP